MLLPRPLGPTITRLAACSRKLEGEEFVEECAVELFGPLVIEVGHGLEGAEARVVQAALEAALQPLALLDLEEATEPGLVDELLGVGKQAIEAEPPQALLEGIKRQVTAAAVAAGVVVVVVAGLGEAGLRGSV